MVAVIGAVLRSDRLVTREAEPGSVEQVSNPQWLAGMVVAEKNRCLPIDALESHPRRFFSRILPRTGTISGTVWGNS
jgi:hypothetical protein